MANKLRSKKCPSNGISYTGDLVQQQLRARPCGNPNYWMLEAADEIERLRQNFEQDQVVQMREFESQIGNDPRKKIKEQAEEIERLNALAIRAWHSFRSGLSFESGCDCGLTDADILELVRLSKSTGDTMSPSAGGEQSHG